MLAIPLLLAGCVTRTPAAPDRLAGVLPDRVPEHLWPTRVSIEFPLSSPAVGSLESELIDRPVTFWIPRSDWRDWLNTMQAGGAMTRLGVVGRGHLSEVLLSPAARTGGLDWSRLFLFFTAAERADLPYAPSPHARTADRDPLEACLTVMRVFEPEGQPRGIIVHLTGIQGFDDERYIARTFVERGYVVMSVPPPSKAVEKDSTAHWRSPAPIPRSEGLIPTADRLARLADWSMAEWAYAVEAGLDRLIKSQPDLGRLPSAVIGCSMGAIALPAVAARSPGFFDAAVIVAGGGPLLDVLHRSSATSDAFTLEWQDGPFLEDDWTRLATIYSERTKFDPAAAAVYLRTIPVLQVHASFDAIVPATTGEQLTKALGSPERWSYPVGHVGMFVVLPFQIESVADWVESHMPAAAQSDR